MPISSATARVKILTNNNKTTNTKYMLLLWNEPLNHDNKIFWNSNEKWTVQSWYLSKKKMKRQQNGKSKKCFIVWMYLEVVALHWITALGSSFSNHGLFSCRNTILFRDAEFWNNHVTYFTCRFSFFKWQRWKTTIHYKYRVTSCFLQVTKKLVTLTFLKLLFSAGPKLY